MKIFEKSLKEYFDSVKIFMLIIFMLSLVQVVLILLGYFPKIEFVKISETAGIFRTNYLNPITLIGFLEIVSTISIGFYLVLQKRFKLRHDFISSILLFSSSLLILFFIPPLLPQMPIAFKVVSCGILFITNLLLFVIASLFGGIIALIYKEFIWKAI